MSAVTPVNSFKTGTCPHGLPPGACPICNGTGGGGARKADFSAKSGEMSWSECAAVGAFLKAQKEARAQRALDFQRSAYSAVAFQASLNGAVQKNANLKQIIANNFPPAIAKPLNFISDVFAKIFNFNRPAAAPQPPANTNKFVDISDKLTALKGELKAAAEEKIAKIWNKIKKTFKSIIAKEADERNSI